MKAHSGVLALAVAAVLLAPASRADAQAAFSDKICPEATQYVVALGKLTQSDTPQQVYDVAHATTGAYETCATRYLANGQVEPQVNYAHTRQASFSIIEARALIALNRPADAKRVLQNSRRLAADVYDWRPGDKRPSNYREAAKDIVDAADAALAKLSAPEPAAGGAPAPSSTPHR
jgi:Ni/Co efflux regulator RcnB